MADQTLEEAAKNLLWDSLSPEQQTQVVLIAYAHRVASDAVNALTKLFDRKESE